MRTIKQTNPEKDLLGWSKEFGSGMAMNWPVFEEYSEELKTIAKGNKAKANKDIGVENNGVTMTSIKHKSDDFNNNINNSNDDSKSYVSNDLARLVLFLFNHLSLLIFFLSAQIKSLNSPDS